MLLITHSIKMTAKRVRPSALSCKRWLNRLTVGEKIVLGYIISLGIAIAGTSTGIVVGNRTQHHAIEQEEYAMEEFKLLSGLQAGVLQSRTHQQQLIPLSEFPTDFQDEYNHILAHATTIKEVWQGLEARVENNPTGYDNTQLLKFLDTYRGVDSRYLDQLDRIVTQIELEGLVTTADIQAAQQQLLAFTNSDLAIAFDGISDELSNLIQSSRSRYRSTKERVALAESLRNQIVISSMLGSLAIAGLLALIISRAINYPIKSVEEVAVKVIQTEDFGLRADVITDDEIGSLTIALNQLIQWVGNRTQALELSRDTLEDKVKKRTQELNAIIDNLGNGLLVVDKKGRVVRANPTLKHTFGLENIDLAGQLAKDFFDESIVQLINQSQAQPVASFSDELPLPNDKVGLATVSSILADSKETPNPLIDLQSNGTVVLIRDITTEKAVDQMKTDFISTVSHELRTPLTSVLGFAKIIQKKLETILLPVIVSEGKEPSTNKKAARAARQVKENLHIIISEGERLTSLINDVLDIAKIEAGRLDWRMTEVDPRAVIEQAIAATSILSRKSGISLVKDIPEELPTIVADQDRIIQVMINLISNAIKFTKVGSVTCAVKLTKHELQITVVDTGIGISVEDQPKVFEKFKQVGEIMTDKPQGTGLGLPICKQIVEHHGGRIWVESTLDVGSRFSLALPLNDSPPNADLPNPTVEELVKHIKANVQQTAPADTQSETAQTKTILVVDDESNIRRLLRQELETEGYRVEEAKDGVSALAAVKKAKPDLIITDVMMPRLDGFDLAAVLKTNPETANIPTVILSIVEDKDRGFRLGIDRYLTKPIDVAELLSSVDILLTSHSASRRKVLVINQDASDSKTLAEVLLSKGYAVAEASTGEEGLHKARTIKPDMMIVDAALSEGHEIIKTIRFEEGLENISVILVGDRDNATT